MLQIEKLQQELDQLPIPWNQFVVTVGKQPKYQVHDQYERYFVGATSVNGLRFNLNCKLGI